MTSRVLFELFGFLLSTNAKVTKMTTVSAMVAKLEKSKELVKKNTSFINLLEDSILM
jgi:hypothetical protein